MGVPKATMPFGDEPLLARVVRRLHSLSGDVMLQALGDPGFPLFEKENTHR